MIDPDDNYEDWVVSKRSVKNFIFIFSCIVIFILMAKLSLHLGK